MLENNLNNSLKNKKLSFTQQRRVILEELEKTEDHLNADQIYSKVKKRMPKVSVGTIYRNLSVLVDLGFVDRVDTSLHSESSFETHKDPHYHIICTSCLRIDDLEHYRALSIEPTAEKISGYKIKNHQIELYGTCPTCQAKEQSVDLLHKDETPAPQEKKEITNNSTYISSPQTNKTDSETLPSINLNDQKPKENEKKPFIQKDKRRKFFLGRKKRNY